MTGHPPLDPPDGGGVEAPVRQLLSAHVAVAADAAAPLQLSSLELVVLAEELEARFGFLVAARELVPANFGSLRLLCAYVARRLAK